MVADNHTMENQIPLVSIGLPVYNGENFVAEAIKCVLSQTFGVNG
jgi:glycosyltransferase involved in cell wall biosynthesis